MERQVRYARQSFHYGRTFVNDDDLNEQAQGWLRDVANERRHYVLKESPRERFERVERDKLKPLAERSFLPIELAPETTERALYPPVEVERRPLKEYAEMAQ